MTLLPQPSDEIIIPILRIENWGTEIQTSKVSTNFLIQSEIHRTWLCGVLRITQQIRCSKQRPTDSCGSCECTQFLQTLEPQCRQLENKDHTITCVYMAYCRSVRDIWARNEWFGYKKQHSCANMTFWLNCLALRSRIFQACCIILLLSSQDLLTPSHGLLLQSPDTWRLLQQMILEGLWQWQGGLFVTAQSQSIPWGMSFFCCEWSNAQWKKNSM